MTLTELAEIEGISRQRAAALVQKLGVETSTGAKGSRLVSIEAFRAARDAMQAARADAPDITEARRRKTAAQAQREELKLASEKGDLLPSADVERAIADCGAKIVALLEQLPLAAGKIWESGRRDGAKGVQRALKDEVRDMRRRIADELAQTAAAAGAREE